MLHGNTQAAGKWLSIFETHTEVIRKGKTNKPNEFGKLVLIQEAENQIVTHYQVCEQRPPDLLCWKDLGSNTSNSSDVPRRAWRRIPASKTPRGICAPAALSKKNRPFAAFQCRRTFSTGKACRLIPPDFGGRSR